MRAGVYPKTGCSACRCDRLGGEHLIVTRLCCWSDPNPRSSVVLSMTFTACRRHELFNSVGHGIGCTRFASSSRFVHYSASVLQPVWLK